MTKEDLLIKLCGLYLKGEKLVPDDSTNLAELYDFAKAHNLMPVCFLSLDFENAKDGFGEIREKFFSGFLDSVYIHQLRQNTLDELKELLKGAEIPFICFKGSVLKELYPVPESRVMGDSDVLIRESDRSKAHKLLIDSGFSCTAENEFVRNYVKDGNLIELHTSLSDEYDMGVFEAPFDYAKFDGCEGRFEDDFHLAYLITHMAHHFRFYGAGVRMLLDVAVMLDKSSADIDAVVKYLESCQLDKFAKVVFTLCKKWFGVGRDFGENTEGAERFLLSGGVFGGENKNKGAVVARRQLETGKKITPFMAKLRLAFPSYSTLKGIDYIKFINGRPWLTPVAWVYRFFYNLKHRKRFMVSAVKDLNKDETKLQAEEQLEFFEEIGIYGK